MTITSCHGLQPCTTPQVEETCVRNGCDGFAETLHVYCIGIGVYQDQNNTSCTTARVSVDTHSDPQRLSSSHHDTQGRLVGCNGWHLVKAETGDPFTLLPQLSAVPLGPQPRVSRRRLSRHPASRTRLVVMRPVSNLWCLGLVPVQDLPTRQPEVLNLLRPATGLVDRAFWLDVACAPLWPDQSSHPVCCVG